MPDKFLLYLATGTAASYNIILLIYGLGSWLNWAALFILVMVVLWMREEND